MSQGEKALNPIAAALGFPGLYWWQSDDAGAVDNANEDNFWTQLVIAAGIVDESYIRTESKKATEAEKQLVEEEQERQRLEAAAAAESNAAAQGVGGQEVSAREVVVPPVPKPPPRLGEADFSLHRPLGRGRFGEVLLATHRTSRSIVALKVLHKELLWNSKMRERARNEFKINVTLLRAGEHPFIVRLMFAFSTRRCLCLALDVAPCGELFQLTTNHEPGSFLGKTQGRRFPEKAARFYVSECLLALEFLHEAKVLYRDLKPENVLLAEDGHVKISDFGLSKPNVSKPLEGAKSMCGTPEYMAPEILQNNHDHGLAIDWWALGALCYELVDGHPPWHAKDRTQLFDKIVKTSLKMPKNVKPKLSVDCLDLLKTLLEKNAPKRLGVEGATQVKNHKFFAMVDFEALFERKIDPPFQPKPPAPTKLDTTVDLDWASIQPQQAPPRGMDITWEKFDQIFNGFEYRADLTAN
ncbi:hypothetical protein CTAYLR_001959 [Chrysophaeum taylorii]|uniref:Uncharacterized protein n=1 Tax=Chrysophaeum taylorii TaxID=2483200 RepID=A0AAD7UAM7_9STRA|nr:hypothetical protein CTAYLR_001959 [Chrysophaeum taylorii]